MKGSRVHFLTPLVIIAIWVIILASTGRADTVSDPVQVWPAFHADMMHVGRNPHSTDLENPASLGPIWVFPRPDANYATEKDTAVDDFGDGTSWFTQFYGRWKQDTNEDAWESRFASDVDTGDTSTPRYHYLTAVASDAAANLKDTATWTFPYGDANRPTVSLGYYYVWVWVPIAPDVFLPSETGYTFTKKAVYTVYDDSGTTQVTFDQSDGGSWQLLSTEQFCFKDTTKKHAVELSNVTEDAAGTVRVAADAVKFVRGTGMEIYSSPVSATIEYKMTPDPAKASNYTTTQEGFDGKAPVVYIGTVEKPLTKDTNAPDLGAVYCVNSVTPTNGTLADNPKYKELSERLGTAIWRYPSRVLKPDETKPPWEPDPRDRDPLEGPIEGGIYSTPTLARVVIGEETKLVCFVTGSDRQIYALDATTGKLLWKGPGMTVSERGDTGWTEITNRDDAFGGSLRYATDPAVTARWAFDAAKLNSTRDGKGVGWAYSVYAWIPPVGYGETHPRGKGKYVISYGDKSTYRVTIDQSQESNQGKWVTLASSCFNVTEVSLQLDSGESVVADAVMVVPNTIGSFSYCSPVANTTLSLSDTDYDSNISTVNATTIYAVTATGRALSFEADGQGAAEDHLCKVNWVYPGIRNKANVTGSDDADQPSMGLIGATPTYWDKETPYLYVAALDGNIHCIDSTTGELAWKFFDKATSDNFGDSVSVGGFTSTPTIDDAKDQLFIGSTTGYFYCINASTGPDSNSKPLWRYPDYDSKKVPLGAFRYSTAVVGDASDGKSGSSEKHRVWIGSVDGHVYSFNAENNAGIKADDRRLWVEYPTETTRDVHGGVDYTELALMSSIQGSVAIDGAAPNDPTRYTRTSDKANVDVYNTMTMYAGDMDGKLHWLSANSGRSDWYYDSTNPSEKQVVLKTSGKGKNYKSFQTEGALFSSPNITHFKISTSSNPTSYVYEGCADGRVYAFSDYGGAWGGGWAGGEYWPFSGDLESLKSEGLAPDAEVQCEIFPSRLYSNSQAFSPQTDVPDPASPDMYSRPVPGASGTDWRYWSNSDGKWIVRPEMKEVKTVPLSTTGPARDTEIDQALFSAAQQQRYIDSNNCYVGGTNRTSDKPVYFEWGETINVVLWNLPERQFLKGRGSSAFTLTMMNASGGTSAGGSITVSSGFKVKEYDVLDASSAVGNTAPLLKYDNGRTVKRSYMYYSFKINYEKTSKGNPPSPGPGWILKVDVLSRESTSSTAAYTRKTYPIARLMAASPYKPFVADEIYQEQDLGVNNPLAIRDDQATLGGAHTSESLAWPANNVFTTDRNNIEAHYNGNAVGDNITYSAGVLPTVDLGTANHGTPSRQAKFWVMDRSAVGTTQNSSGSPNKLKRFRIDAGELNWNGGSTALTSSGGVKFPWEFDIGSADYPNITQQYQSYQKASDGADPANNSTELPCVYDTDGTAPLDYSKCTMQPDIVLVAANVPRFQPANIYGAGSSNSGYSRRMEVYVDSDGDGVWDTPDVVNGRQTGYQEAYRKFSTGVRVPPDPKIEVEEQTVDVGKAPHGLGVGLTLNQEFSPFNPNPDVAQWFKTVTIKNAGNVNIPDIYIGRKVRMYSDQAGSVSPVPDGCVTSSLDWGSSGGFSTFKQPPFTTLGYGYTLTKSKVGDPDPSILTIPDKRKWDMDNGYAKTATEAAVTDLNGTFHTGLDPDQPLPVKVSVKVPLAQPIGAYHSYESSYGLPFVPVFADLNGDGVLTAYEPYAQTSFQLNVSVRENQLTGGVTPMTLPQIDADSVARLGDSTPAAFRDTNSGNVYLFWSSNRMFDLTMYPNWLDVTDPKRTDFANAPWFIDRATLNWNSSDWQSAQTTPNQWWQVPTAAATATLPPKAIQWPTDISTPMMWTLDGSATDFYSVRHHSPVIARTLTSDSVVEKDPTWLVWAGDADIMKSNNKIAQDHLIFYTNATGGDVTSSESTLKYIKHDPAKIKRSPSMAMFNDRAWMFWQGENDSKSSIMYSTNESALLPMDGWADDSALRTPDCLSSVSSPNCILRRFWGSLTSNPNYSDSKQLLDIIYAGTDKYTQNSDILLGRYIAANQTDVDAKTNSNDRAALKDALPSSVAQPLPRVFDEKLKRDPKYGFYMSQHLAWIRPNFDFLTTDSWGRDSYTISTTDAPYIHVVLPEGYVLPNGSTVTYKKVVSATDGSIRSIDASGNETVDVEPSTPVCTYDEATGIYTYKYSDPTTKSIIGDMLIDFSAGTVRFTESLKEVANGDSFIAPEVRADYTPQSWRITTDEAVDNSPRAFIERTDMNTTTNPGMGTFEGTSAPIDRLWVFWRKAGTGVKTSTIYYKTYRVGVDLTKLGYAPIPMITQRSVSGAAIGHVDPAANLTVNNARGPWEVNRAGTKIYFSEVDERYQSLKKSGYSGMGIFPTDITISYTPSGLTSPINVIVKDAYWIEETPEQSLLGFSADGNVNEDSIYAFADPGYPNSGGTLVPAISSKIWVFWTSTRSGTSDLFWETVSPNFAAD